MRVDASWAEAGVASFWGNAALLVAPGDHFATVLVALVHVLVALKEAGVTSRLYKRCTLMLSVMYDFVRS